MGVYFGQDYSAMQGPAPDGFHVPLNEEWGAVYDVWTALGGGSSDGTNFGIALKLPLSGYRFGTNAGVLFQGLRCGYWSSSRTNALNAYYMSFYSSAINAHNSSERSEGYSVRCFKDTPVIPDNSWTIEYQPDRATGADVVGIYHNPTLGLISLSSNGQTWITIADKNLGATTVWSSGDTLSETNCGKYFQRGNNYGFPRTGTIANQSTTQVDASNYGPGNYYSSDTFIKYSGSRDSSDNGNLWGGVTGVMPSELKNAYIGEYVEGRQPGANTLAYRPLTSTTTVNDQSGNNKNLTNANVTFGSYKGIDCAYFNGTSSTLYATMPTNQQALTISGRMYFVWNGKTAESYNGHFWRWGSNFGPYVSNESNKKFVCSPGGIGTYYLTSDTAWKYVTITFNGSNTVKIYINGVLDGTNSSANVPSGTGLAIGSNYNHTGNRWKGGVSEFIVEDKVRTDQEITDYYNNTKSDYGL